MQCLNTILLLSAAVSFWNGCTCDHTYCAYTSNQNASNSLSSSSSSRNGLKHDDATGEVFENSTVRCHEEQKYCFSMWYPASENGSRLIVMQGCWNKPTDICSETSCLAHGNNYESVNRKNSKFCCCSGDHCNLDIVDVELPYHNITASPIITRGAHIIHDGSYRQNTIIIAIASVLSVAIVITIGYLVYRLLIVRYKDPPELPEIPEVITQPSFELDQLKLSSLIERGRYGEVWKGLLNEHDVAVKKFTANQRRYYMNEKDVYTLPYMDHPNLCKFYGAEERIGTDGMGQYFLVISYVENGTLMAHLKNNLLTWNHLCRMAQSVTAGLAHLHTDINLAGKVKPAIAHRDFNTRNIMVRPDQTCVVCDLGFAMKIARTRFQEEGEMTSLTDVGTLRYMAPEVLDGAVNLRDCEASLKQIDIYALGLVLWEIASRCSELYQGMTVPEYQLPFQTECGVHPSFEEMQLLVSRNKSRPAFPDVWKDTNQAVRALKETIEDCWDQDAEARLTALCVEERLIEMAALWEARHKGVTPTINTVSQFGSGVGGSSSQRASLITSQLPQSLTNTTDLSTMSEDRQTDQADRNGNLPHPQSQISSGQSAGIDGADHFSRSTGNSHNRLSQSGAEYSVSSSTTETTLTSPSEPDVSHHINTKANCNLNFAKTNKMLQPHQGQNPIVERNTHKRSDEELAIVGNTLVDKTTLNKPKCEPSSADNTNRAFTDDLYDAIADNLETSLVQNDLLSQQRNTPIPYLQNQMHDPDSATTSTTTTAVGVVRPKQPNIPGNGSAHLNVNKSNKASKANKAKKSKDKYSVWQNLFNWNPLSKSHQNIDSGEAAGMTGSETHAMAAVLTPLLQNSQQRGQPDRTLEAAKSNLEPHDEAAMNTEVRLVNGSPIVRPTTLHVNDRESTGSVHSEHSDSRENRLGFAEVGIAKLQASCNARPAVLKMRRKSQSSGDLSPTVPVNGVDNTDSSDSHLLRRPISSHSPQINTRDLDLAENLTTSDSNQNVLIEQNGDRTSTADISRHSDFSAKNANTNDNQDTTCNNPLAVSKIKAKQRARMMPHLLQTHPALCNGDHIVTKSCEDVSAHRVGMCGGKKTEQEPSSISLQQFGSIDSNIGTVRAANFHC